jgi:hypothetical protein
MNEQTEKELAKLSGDLKDALAGDTHKQRKISRMIKASWPKIKSEAESMKGDRAKSDPEICT